jgi:hypothetical protein
MNYGITPGAAAAAAAAAGSAASPGQIAKSQAEAFTMATSASKLVGPPVRAALMYVNGGIPMISGAFTEMVKARDLLADAANTLSPLSGALGTVASWAGYSQIASGHSTAVQAHNLVQAYAVDVGNVLQALSNIRYTLQRNTFTYRETTVGKHDVKSCANLRMFKGQADDAKKSLGAIYRDLYQIRETLYSYGRTAGKQRRNQTKQLITTAKLTVNDVMTLLTRVARSGSLVRNIRRGIDVANDPPCGSYYQGSGQTPANWNDAQAGDCHGLNALRDIFKLVAAKQGRSWTNYRMRYANLSNSDKERNIITGLTLLRDDVVAPLRNRKIPNAREDFVNIFKGMSDVIGKRKTQFTAAQRRALGPMAQAALEVTEVMNDVRRADAQANSLAFPLAVLGDLTPVQCQYGSGYAGIFGGDDGEPMNPMLAVGGGLVAGVAVAHFLPNLLRR